MKETIKTDENGNKKALSPFTKSYDVLVDNSEEAGESRLCLISGFNTRELYKTGNADVEKFEEQSTELIRNMRYEDKELDQYWYLTTVITKDGMIFPDFHETDDYEWVFAPIVQISEDEKEKYPIPDKPGEFYGSRLAIEAQEKFHKESFMSACRRLGAVKTS